nr:VRR-NUC domain-containing protein [Ruminiclostridium sufflavum]
MREKDIESYLVKRIKDIGGKAYKFISPGNAGVPDRVILLQHGVSIFVELKAPGKKSTALQQVQQKKISELGFWVQVIDSKQRVDELIEMVGKLESIRKGDAK